MNFVMQKNYNLKRVRHNLRFYMVEARGAFAAAANANKGKPAVSPKRKPAVSPKGKPAVSPKGRSAAARAQVVSVPKAPKYPYCFTTDDKRIKAAKLPNPLNYTQSDPLLHFMLSNAESQF